MNIGTIIQWGSDELPQGWLLCNGSEVSRETFKDLFQIIGTKFGEGDGISTFNLPDLRGRVAVGKSEETEFNVLGKTGGEKKHQLTIEEMPSHNHCDSSIMTANDTKTVLPNYGADRNETGYYMLDDARGGDQPHNVLQPYQTLNFIIKATLSGTKKISELEEATSINDNDLLVIVDTKNDETKKITFDKFKTKDVYVEDEIETNKEFLGKKVYRKIITIDIIGQLNEWFEIGTIPNFESIVSVNANLYETNNVYSLLFYEYGTWYANKGTQKIYFLPKSQFALDKNSQWIIEYTKVTN